MSRRDYRLDALETLYRDGFERFLRVSITIVGDRGLALDAVQEGFARAIHRRAGFRGRGSLEAWVWRIVVNEALGSLPARSPHRLSLSAVTDPGGATYLGR